VKAPITSLPAAPAIERPPITRSVSDSPTASTGPASPPPSRLRGGFRALFAALDQVERRLARALSGRQSHDRTDWRLFTTLVRFDAAYAPFHKVQTLPGSPTTNLIELSARSLPVAVVFRDREHGSHQSAFITAPTNRSIPRHRAASNRIAIFSAPQIGEGWRVMPPATLSREASPPPLTGAPTEPRAMRACALPAVVSAGSSSRLKTGDARSSLLSYCGRALAECLDDVHSTDGPRYYGH